MEKYKEQIEKEAEIRQLFKNNSDCYADTHWYSDDTIPPTKVEGEVIQAMTEDAFIKISERIKIEYAISILEEMANKYEYINPQMIENNISELKNKRDGK